MLLGPLVENIMVLLTYDETKARLIRGTIDIKLYGGPYRALAACCYDYLDRYGKPPGDHLPDLMATQLEAPGGNIFRDIIVAIHDVREGVNTEYVMAQLELFVRRQSLRTVAIDLAKALQRDTEESLEEAERLIGSARQVSLKVFDPGTRLSDKKRALAFLDSQGDTLPTGVPELDKRGFGPTRKELWLYISDTKQGKTWALGQLARSALLQRYRVVHVTLEMPERRAAQRYFQTFFAMAKRSEPVTVTRFKRNGGAELQYDHHEVKPALALNAHNIREKLLQRIDKWSNRVLDNIIVKEFPTGSLTVPQLEAYLDNLEATERFVPDLLLIDYPDLMKLDKENYRLEIDELYKNLRGLAGKRNLALACVSQSHRQAAKAKLVGRENVAESYAKVAHADTVITYSQTLQERQSGLARLHVAAGRYDEDRITVVISQNYTMGQYVIDSALMTKGYFDGLPEES